jgi:L-serine dehydratase
MTGNYLSPIFSDKTLAVAGVHTIDFDVERDLYWYDDTVLPYHPNALTIRAILTDDTPYQQTYYSIGGGFVINEEDATNPDEDHASPTIDIVPYPFDNAAELLEQCRQHRLSISDLVLANECHYRDKEEIFAYLDTIWEVMQNCVTQGCENSGILPGGLDVKRRAKDLHLQLIAERDQPISKTDKLAAMDWVDLYALAVNEENANGGNVVTAPTNGAAGIIPAVLHYYRDFLQGYTQDGVRKFLLNATAIGSLIKQNASISGAEVGCQGEVGSACAMAASALAELMGGDPAKCLNAAEIGIEHNLGLTCDPIGGLVQVPCIERNAMGAVKAINAARLACRGNGQHFVSLDKAIQTMKETGADMSDKYKETARGGLAVYADNRIPTATRGVSVNYSQC